MKTRLGFVSNSSSSSFLVAFDKLPESENELKILMFPNRTNDQVEIYGYVAEIDRIVERVFRDIKDNPKYKNLNDLKASAMYGSTLEHHFAGWNIYKEAKVKLEKDYPDLYLSLNNYSQDPRSINERQEAWQKEEEISNELALEAASKWFEENPAEVYVEFEYSDNEGEFETILEHYGIFDDMRCKTTSHH